MNTHDRILLEAANRHEQMAANGRISNPAERVVAEYRHYHDVAVKAKISEEAIIAMQAETEDNVDLSAEEVRALVRATMIMRRWRELASHDWNYWLVKISHICGMLKKNV